MCCRVNWRMRMVVFLSAAWRIESAITQPETQSATAASTIGYHVRSSKLAPRRIVCLLVYQTHEIKLTIKLIGFCSRVREKAFLVQPLRNLDVSALQSASLI